jgi:hypothetical protein
MRSSSIAACGRFIIAVAGALAIVSIASHAWAQGSGDGARPDDSGAGQAAGPADTTGAGQAAGSADTAGAGQASGPTDTPAGTPAGTPAESTGAAIDPSDVPVNLRLRRLEQQVQALKERAWRAKARVGMLKEAVLGGGVGATATVMHKNNMGSSFRLIQLVYALDGSQVFARVDDSGALHKNKSFEVLTGPIAPGSHTISVLAVYRGHGYGVFKYLTKYKFTVRSSHTFTVSEGKSTRIEAVGFEKGGVTTPLEDRPAMDFKVTHASGPGGN